MISSITRTWKVDLPARARWTLAASAVMWSDLRRHREVRGDVVLERAREAEALLRHGELARAPAGRLELLRALVGEPEDLGRVVRGRGRELLELDRVARRGALVARDE